MSPRGNGNGALALRPPPHNLEAEMAVLGAIFVDNDTFEKVSGFLRAEHFGFVPHGLIFEAAAALIERRRVADPVTLLRYFEQDETLAQIGGPAYLAKLAHAAVGPISAGQYGELIVDLYVKRLLIQEGEDLATKAYDGSADATAADIIVEQQTRLDRLAGECPAPLCINGEIVGATDPSLFVGDTPERRWLVHEWIPWGNVTMLSGDGGVGKSLLLQQLLTCAAIGLDWLGQRVEPVKAMGVFCEDDDDELRRRQDAINAHLNIGPEDLTKLRWLCRAGEDNALMTFPFHDAPGERAPFFQQVLNAAKGHGAQLVGLDALHDFFVGNENVRPQARGFINALRSLATGTDGSVVLTAHPSLSGLGSGSGMSGSTAWNNAVRSRLYLTRPKDEGDTDQNERVLQRKKANYAGSGDEIRLTWVNGVFTHQPQEIGMVDAAARGIRADRVFLELLATSTKNGVKVSAAPQSRNNAPLQFSREPREDRVGCTKKDFDGAMRRLLKIGKVKSAEYGSPSARKHRLVIAEGAVE